MTKCVTCLNVCSFLAHRHNLAQGRLPALSPQRGEGELCCGCPHDPFEVAVPSSEKGCMSPELSWGGDTRTLSFL